jgi:carbonic anhydrase
MNLKLFIFCIYLIKLTLCAETWNYFDKGPDYWPRIPSADLANNQCNGRMQSPINIVTNAAAYDKSLSDISFNNYDAEINWDIRNTGYTGI